MGHCMAPAFEHNVSESSVVELVTVLTVLDGDDDFTREI